MFEIVRLWPSGAEVCIKLTTFRQSSSKLGCNGYNVSMVAVGAVKGSNIEACRSSRNESQGHSGIAL
jgi:hypothetical protein